MLKKEKLTTKKRLEELLENIYESFASLGGALERRVHMALNKGFVVKIDNGFVLNFKGGKKLVFILNEEGGDSIVISEKGQRDDPLCFEIKDWDGRFYLEGILKELNGFYSDELLNANIQYMIQNIACRPLLTKKTVEMIENCI
ncbi:MAG: hypothetical protein GY679_01515 [Mycoplasma sp.]|nr:hypothetical protein [Mycoplasma sp.]